MKTKLCLITLVCIVFGLTIPISAQVAFRHVTSPGNVQGHITRLDHPQLNGNPNALVFIMPNYNTNGADPSGADYQQNAGIYYSGGRWAIFNQNIKAPMPVNLTFNVLVAPAGNSNYFSVTCTQNSKAGLAPNGMVIDHPATNNKPNVLLMITQNWSGTYNDNSQVVSYANGKWYISNNKYLSPDPAISAKSTLPVGARFNVMVITNGVVPGFPTAKAFMHTVTPNNILAGGITYFDQPFLNGNTKVMLWATPNWGWSPGGAAGQTSGPYNDSPINAWYDHPTDPWNYKNGYWTIFNNDGTNMKAGAKFNVLAMPVGAIRPVSLNFEMFNPNTANREVVQITTTLPFRTTAQQITVEVVDGQVIYQGDIILGRESDFFDRQNGKLIPKARTNNDWQKDAAVVGDRFRWPNGAIPFEIQANHPDERNIREAIRIINQRTRLCIQPRTNQADYVRFVTINSRGEGGCSSNVGRRGGLQEITINGCPLGSIQHEILHAAGMFHEQSRSDRDNFVRINRDNIIPDRINNFEREDNTISSCPYDYGSIMHYPASAFAIDPDDPNRNTTIVALRPLPVGVIMGQRNGLSNCDIQGINTLYQNASGCLTPNPAMTRTFTPNPLGILCPNLKTRGDAEFAGGPLIQCNVRIQVSPGGEYLEAIVYFKAEETKGDYSTVEQNFVQRLWSAPTNQRITGITSTTTSTSTLRGPGAGGEAFGCNDGQVLQMPIVGNLVRLIQVIGDTGNGDISHDNDCGCDTQIRRIEFNPITVTLSQR